MSDSPFVGNLKRLACSHGIAGSCPACEPLDSIDLAYSQRDYPMFRVQARVETNEGERQRVLDALRSMRYASGIILPEGFELEFLGPKFTGGTPFELARWADDGGRV